MAFSTAAEGLNFQGFRALFYMVTPSETSFPTVEIVPHYIERALGWFFILMGLEILACFATGHKDRYSANDSFTSMGAGLLQSSVKILVRSIDFAIYCKIYETFHMIELPWNSKWTWVLSFLLMDFAYYWFHRVGHETMLGWAVHQMHHSSEYYNLSTALRQGMCQMFVSMFFYFPIALLIPPPIHLVHTMLNLLYQFWIHTQMISSLGPLELIINTPSHHRVHHGRNPYCIDKNYGGTLIIWDRLFGTFQKENENETIAYGLVHNVESFNQIYCQLFYLKETLWDKPRSLKGGWDKLQTPLRGPGWQPETAIQDPYPQIEHPVQLYSPPVPTWINFYVAVHFLLCVLTYAYLAAEQPKMTFDLTILYVLFITLSLQCFGAFFDNKWYAGFAELGRCITIYSVLISGQIIPLEGFGAVLQSLFALSASLWFVNAISFLKEANKSKTY